MIGKTNANANAILFQHVESLEKVISADLPLSGWILNSDGLYYQEILIDDITAQDMAQLLKYTSPSISEDDYAKYSTDFALITGGQAGNGKIAFYAKDILSQDITVFLGMGKKGDGRLLIGGSSASEKQQIANVVITITDNAAIAEGGSVTATCNGKSWSSTIKNGKAKLYASSVGNYTITVNATDGATYTTMLICPYFGQFSTDIYSGTLVVTCTEDGGNGKTCNVQSCDASYNPTDAYNLSQIFDSSLKLTFLGIPAGKYLVTVDDKYVFFKEIESIQNINSVNIELKQWLFKNGEMFPWNTGGWSYGKSEWSHDNRRNSSGSATCLLNFDHVYFSCQAAASTYYGNDDGYSGYYLATSLAYANIIMNKAWNADMVNKYSTAVIDGQKISATGNLTPKFVLRTGLSNTSDTTITTPTVVYSGSIDTTGKINLDLQHLNIGTDSFFVFGMIIGSGGHAGWKENTGSYSYEYTYKLFSLYLI